MKKQSPRKDPVSTRTDNSGGALGLVNQDPSRKYTAVCPGQEFMGQDYYESMGYRVELATEGGVRFRRRPNARIGEPLTAGKGLDLVLMSIDREEYERIREEGVNGNGGRKKVEAMEKRMVRNRGKADAMRGVYDLGNVGPNMAVVNETMPDTVEASRL